ncbi:MAG: conjugal transfer protein TraD [Nitrospirae bacterium]|nr:conjugal transfer protein TraD [Nitrospirota bacterium]MBF0463078.1 conjugal transfer protein TraD [Magnetococcales bacterium]
MSDNPTPDKPKAALPTVRELAAQIKAANPSMPQSLAELYAREKIADLKVKATDAANKAALEAKKSVAQKIRQFGGKSFRKEEGKAKIEAGGLLVKAGIIVVDRVAKTVGYAPGWDAGTVLGLLLAATHAKPDALASWKSHGSQVLAQDAAAKAAKKATPTADKPVVAAEPEPEPAAEASPEPVEDRPKLLTLAVGFPNFNVETDAKYRDYLKLTLEFKWKDYKHWEPADAMTQDKAWIGEVTEKQFAEMQAFLQNYRHVIHEIV